MFFSRIGKWREFSEGFCGIVTMIREMYEECNDEYIPTTSKQNFEYSCTGAKFLNFAPAPPFPYTTITQSACTAV